MFNRTKSSARKVMYSLCAFSTMAFCVVADQAPADIQKAAVSGLPQLLASITPDMYGQFNFASGDNLSACTLGEPFHINTILPKALESYTPGSDVKAILTETDSWFFPIYYKGSLKAFLDVSLVEGSWQAGSIGYAPLALAVEQLLKTWPREKGYTPRLICVFAAQQYLFTIPQKGTTNLTPLTFEPSGGTGLAKAASAKFTTLNNSTTVVENLRVKVRNAYEHQYGKK